MENASSFISTDQKYKYRITSPYYAAIDERVVNGFWPSKNLHWHEYFEMEIILDGNGTHQYNNTSFSLNRGCVYLLTPMDVHALIPDPGTELHLIHLRFDNRAVSEELHNTLLQYDCSYPVRLDSGELNRLLTQLDELTLCFQEPTILQSTSIKLLLSYICLLIIQKLKPETDRFSTYDTSNTVVHQTMLYIFYNFRQKITMDELGRIAHVSPNHLAVLFKRAIGSTCMQVIYELRMQYALKLLKMASLSIETIAEESGFSSVSYFVSMFHKQFGITPKEYKSRETGESTAAS